MYIPLRTACVWADDDAVLPASDLALDVGQHEGLRPQIVDGDVEKALYLARVEVHGDNVVAAGDHEHVGDELRSDRRARLVLFVHARVREARNDCRNAARRGCLAGGNEDEELHEVVVHIVAAGLQNKDVLVAHRL